MKVARPRNPVASRCQDVDEAGERRAVVQLVADDVEGEAGGAADLRRAVRPDDALADAAQRWQQATGSLNLPDSVELAHHL